MLFLALCVIALTAAQTPGPPSSPHNLSVPLPPISLCKSGGQSPAFFCVEGAVFTPRGANYIRLWPEDAPAYHGWAKRLFAACAQVYLTCCSTFSPLHYEQAKAEAAGEACVTNSTAPESVAFMLRFNQYCSSVAALSADGYNVVRVFIDHGDGARVDSVGGMTPDDASVALGKECV
jgi:hypothetical protein